MFPRFFSVKRQASQTPSESKKMVFFFDSLVCSYSTAELGRWLEITQRAQYSTPGGSPYLTSRSFTSGRNLDLSVSRGSGIRAIHPLHQEKRCWGALFGR